MRRFLWAGHDKDRFHALVGWNWVTTDKNSGGLGLRDLRLMNTALLGKLIWSMLYDKDKPWVQVFSSKYLKGDSVLNAKASPSCSSAWHGIILDLKELQAGFDPKINDGFSSFWYEDWTGHGKLCNAVDYVHISDTDLRVFDVFSPDVWDFRHLFTPLPPEFSHIFADIPGPTLLNSPDCFIWAPSPSGVYSTWSAYAWLRESPAPHDDSTPWKKFWKCKLSEKIKFLLWLILHKALPTNAFRAHCHLSDSPSCPRCSNNMESILHCIRDCPHSREIWLRMGLCHLSNFFSLDTVSWIFQQLDVEDMELRLLSIWWVWRWRNNMILDSSRWKINFVVRNIFLDALSLKLVVSTDSILVPPDPMVSSCVRLSVDGSWFPQHSRLGFGGLLRDSQGRWLAGFSGGRSNGDPCLTEILAVWRGLLVAWDMGFRVIRCEIDSLDVVNSLILRHVAHLHTHASCLNDIFSLVDRSWSVSFLYVDRDSNSCADALAKMGACSNSDYEYWLNPPSPMLKWLLKDSTV
ncbi:Ribonuclease H-like superfamily [Sesbania bispinosa]|nr:Ribonuclease H-like superfamily [Sesbania bispinosa]